MENLKNLIASNYEVNIYVKRWFDKINGNSYFNYYINIGGENIPAKYNMEYGYGNHPFYTAKEHLKELLGTNFDNKINNIDLGYGLKKDMKNLNI